MNTPLTPVPFTRVTFADLFRAPRIETNRTVTLPAEHAVGAQACAHSIRQ